MLCTRFAIWGMGALIALLPGCSFIFVERAPPDHEQRASFVCTSSYVAPILDTVVVGLQAAALVAQARGTAEEEASTEARLMQAAFGIVAAASAIHGYSRVPECQEARIALDARVAKEQQALQAYRALKLSAPPVMSPPPTMAPPGPSLEAPSGSHDQQETLPLETPAP